MPFPAARPHLRTEKAAADMELLRQVVVGVRNIRAELGISPAVRLTAWS